MSEINNIPERSFQARSNLAIIYTQFNDLNFYIEDRFKENFYLNLLKKLFPTIEISRIFGLGGKKNVKLAAEKTLLSKKDIYILDLDFDQILNKKVESKNLFYLERYSIENYLIENIGICEYVKEEKTTLKDEEFKAQFDVEDFILHVGNMLIDLAACCLIIDKYNLGIPYFQINIARDFDLTSLPFKSKNQFISDYIATVKADLLIKKPRIKFQNQIKIAKQHFLNEKVIVNMPGKYLLNVIKFVLVSKFGVIPHTTNESFNYRVGKNCSLKSMTFLKENILKFVN